MQSENKPTWLQAPPAPVGTPDQALTHADRCDMCNAQAYVMATDLASRLPLLFCGHHFTEHERNGHFTPMTHDVLDERPRLRADVEAQANRKEVS